MPILDHEHKIQPFEGPLLTPAEKVSQGLPADKHFFKNGRCDLSGCDFYTFAEIPVLRIRSPRIVRNKKH